MYNKKTWETFTSWTINDPKTGDKLIKRKDDNEKSILKRIDEYINITLPVIDVDKIEWKVIEVNADQNIEEVGREMIAKLGL